MKIQQKLAAALAALLIILSISPIFPVNAGNLPDPSITTPDNAFQPNEMPLQAVTADAPVLPLPSEAPKFSASVEYSHQGYIVQGTFTEFFSDIQLIQPMYSLDGEIYQDCGINWDLSWMDKADGQAKLQTQICLYSNQEPLKNYLDGSLDRFCLKLRITRQNGLTYDTQAAVIDRGDPQPLPKEFTPVATFAPSMIAREMRPLRFFGKYQLTVRTDSSSEDVSAYLPDTLPIEIQLQKGIEHVTEGTIDCPVTWKPLALPQLTAGETVWIPDVCEEIIIPGGTLLNTPKGIFQLDEPLKMSIEYGLTDEVRLFLNVIPEHGEPTGVLSCENAGLEMAFQQKPTGATAIQAYTYSEGSPEWTKLPDLPLLDAVNGQPSTASSDYVLMISNDMEPYRSYLEEKTAGNTPAPIFIGLKIEGGVFDGQQLVLAWPDTYDLPLDLPNVGGSGGNENNAGAGNKDDSNTEGQRPNLPQNPEDRPEEQRPNPSQASEDTLEKHPPSLPENPENKEESNSPIVPRPGRMNHILKTMIDLAVETGKTSNPGTPLFSFAASAQTKTGGNPQKKYPAKLPSSSTGTNIHGKTAMPETLPTETKAPASPAISDMEETPDILRNPGQKGEIHYASFPLMLAIAAAALSVLGVCIFVFRRRNSGRQ